MDLRSRSFLLFAALWLCCLAGTAVHAQSGGYAQGLLVYRDKELREDKYLPATLYSELIEDGANVSVNTGTGSPLNLWKTQVVEVVDFQEIFTRDFVDDSGLQVVSALRQQLEKTRARFPKSEPLLKQVNTVLDDITNKYTQQNLVRVSGKWQPRADYIAARRSAGLSIPGEPAKPAARSSSSDTPMPAPAAPQPAKQPNTDEITWEPGEATPTTGGGQVLESYAQEYAEQFILEPNTTQLRALPVPASWKPKSSLLGTMKQPGYKPVEFRLIEGPDQGGIAILYATRGGGMEGAVIFTAMNLVNGLAATPEPLAGLILNSAEVNAAVGEWLPFGISALKVVMKARQAKKPGAEAPPFTDYVQRDFGTFLCTLEVAEPHLTTSGTTVLGYRLFFTP